jgi:multiple sugar transport system substrate-binding protein
MIFSAALRSVPVALVALALGLALAPAGCAPEAGKPEGGGSEGGRVIRFVTWKPNVPEAWEEVYRRFHAAHPGWRVEREIGPHSSTAFHDMLTQKLKNRSPEVDVFLMDVVWPPEFGSAGWALALGESLTPAEREAFFPATIRAATYRGRLYGLPFNIDSGVLYYRKDLLERHGYQPPETWPRLVEQAREIVAARSRAGGGHLAGYSGQFKQYEGLVCDMLELILSAGGGIVDPGSRRCLLAEPPALRAVEFARRELIGRAAPRGALMYQEPESLALFVQGRAVFMRNWPYAWAVANNPDKSKVAGKVGIARLPRFPGQRSHAALGGWQVGVSAYSRRRQGAWAFARFLAGPEVQKLMATTAGRAPARKALYDDPEVLAAQPHLARLKEVFLTAHPRPRTPVYPAVSQLLQVYFSRALAEPGEPLEPMARSCCRQVEELFALAERAQEQSR